MSLRRTLLRAGAALGTLLALAGPAAAQADTATAPQGDRARDPQHLVISLVTMGPGPNIWDRFGHSAIWVKDTLSGESLAYNYGLFDFNQDDFLLRFLRGRMWYWMAPFPAERYIGSYIRDDRSVWVQELNLEPFQRAALRDFLEWNALPENRFYGYDYYRDNCSTRVRDALDRVLGGLIRAATDTAPTGTSYRSQTRRLVAADPLAYTGMNAALGALTDRDLTRWEAMFVPMEMQRALRDVRLPAAGGGTIPLVRAEYALYESETFAERPAPPMWWPVYLAIGILVGGLLVTAARSRHRLARRGFALLAGAWSAAVGVVGLIMTALWAFTEHVAAYRNENLLQASLLILPLAVLAPRLAVGSRWAARPAVALATAVAALSVLGFVLQVVPGMDQVNGETIALLLPANVGLWLAVRTYARRLEPDQSRMVSPSAAASTASPGAASAA